MRWVGTAAGGAVVALLLAGTATAAPIQGDFDGDGRDDLAVGVIGQRVGDVPLAGSVHVIYGGPNGLSRRDRIFTQDTPRVKEKAETSDSFGGSMTAGDFDADGFDDLAVSAWTEDHRGVDDLGVVHVLYGSRRGLTAKGNQLLEPGRTGIRPAPNPQDFFGWSLAAGDFGRGRASDLVIQTSGVEIDGVDRAGAVNVLYGSRRGLRGRGAQLFSQATPGIPDLPELNDVFGWSLTAGDMGRSRRDDLAIGVPFEMIRGRDDAGIAHVLYGSRRGLRAKGNDVVVQGPDDDDGGGKPDAGDQFGWALAAGNFGDGPDGDLAISAPGETLAQGEVGAVERGLRETGRARARRLPPVHRAARLGGGRRPRGKRHVRARARGRQRRHHQARRPRRRNPLRGGDRVRQPDRRRRRVLRGRAGAEHEWARAAVLQPGHARGRERAEHGRPVRPRDRVGPLRGRRPGRPRGRGRERGPGTDRRARAPREPDGERSRCRCRASRHRGRAHRRGRPVPVRGRGRARRPSPAERLSSAPPCRAPARASPSTERARLRAAPPCARRPPPSSLQKALDNGARECMVAESRSTLSNAAQQGGE